MIRLTESLEEEKCSINVAVLFGGDRTETSYLQPYPGLHLPLENGTKERLLVFY